jgi:hypothetical protein
MRCALIQVLLIGAAPLSASPQSVEPAFVFDKGAPETCLSGTVKPEWHREMTERLPEFASLWRDKGPQMVQAVRKITGKEFSPQSKITLTLCSTPSNSFFGVTVNMRYALRSFTSSPVPLRYKVDTAFHEMLHTFVDRATASSSPELSVHASESMCVRNHLHLLALQKAVLMEVGEIHALEQVVALDSLLPSGCYKRAWAIVNSPDVYRSLLTELGR